MATTPTPGEILEDDSREKLTSYQQDKKVFDDLLRAQEKKTLAKTEESKKRRKQNIVNSLEARQAKSFTRIAEDAFIQADINYKENPTPQNKAKWDSAYADFVKATSEYKDITDTTYKANRVKQEIVGNLPAEPKGFDPRQKGMAGAQTPADRAKVLGGTPTYVPPNTLDNSRWNPNSFVSVDGDPLSNSFTTGNYKDPVAVAFIANENGSIYQNDAGDPIDLVSYVDKVIAEYSNAGKMNELRSLLAKVTADPAELAALDKARNMQGSDYSGSDFYTRGLVQRAVQFTTIANIFNSGIKTNKPKFLTLNEFLKSNKAGDLISTYMKNNNGYGGSGVPRRTVSLSKRTYTPEDLELNIDAFFQEYTGQGATKEDVDYLVKRLNKQGTEKTVTTNSGNTSKSVTTGGVSQGEQQLMMREMALKDPAAESYNKATTYLNYFREALESPIELG